MHPILFQIGDFFVGTYGFMIVLGLLAGLGLALKLSGPRGIPGEFFYDLAFIALAAGFLGARVLYIIVNFGQFLDDPGSLIFTRFGFVFMGGLIAAALAVLILIRVRRMPKWEVGDAAAPGLALGHAIGRIGCYLAGCCYGRVVPAESFFAVRFPKIENFGFAYQDHLHRGLVTAADSASAPVLPTQLFESGSNLVIMAVLLLLWRRRRFSGQIFGSYLILYGAARFVLENMRGDDERGFLGLLSTSQLISLAAVATGTGILLWRMKKGFEPAPEPAASPDVPASTATKPRKNKKHGK